MKNVCVFASSSQKLADIYYKEAEELGTMLGQNGFNIVYGGSRLGMMYACASKVKENGGKIYGVMPQRLYDLGFGNENDCDDFFITTGMRERKAKMDELSSSIVALAGGFGTLEELSEMIVQKQLGYNNKPIVFLNTNRFYDSLREFFDKIIEENFAKTDSKNLFYIADTPQDAVNYLLTYNVCEPQYSGKF